MFVALMAFFAKISDSSVGGTYMTLLNTLTNLGGNWPAILALYFVDPLTWKQCEGGAESLDNTCRTTVEKDVSIVGICIGCIQNALVVLNNTYLMETICFSSLLVK